MSNSHEKSISDVESQVSYRHNAGAILTPAIYALVLLIIFAVSFVGTKLAYDRYAEMCATTHFDKTKLGNVAIYGITAN